VLGASFAVVVTIMILVLVRAPSSRAAAPFTLREVEQAQREILPFRRSGLIFHWADDSPTVYVTRSMWEALPENTRQELGRSIVAAKNRPKITVFDETLVTPMAVCTAKSGCASTRDSREAAPR
jgi:hypothetical protein